MKHAALLLSCLAAALLSACGGGGSETTPTNPQPSNATTVQINLGDDPADRLLAVGVTINNVSLTSAGGNSVSVLSAPRPMEMMQWLGAVAPLALAGVPQGTYTGATMSFGAATVTYVDAATGQMVQKRVPGPMTGNVMFSPALTVGATPMVVNLDMNMAASIAIDANGNVSMAPVMSARTNPYVSGGRDAEDGGMYGLTGMINGSGGNAFTLAMMQGLSGVSLLTGAGTRFAGMSGIGMMANSMLVTLDAALQPDGNWMASRVQSWTGAGGAMAAGLVTSLTGNPPTQLVLVMQDGIGNGVMSTNLAGTTTVNIGDATQFSIGSDNVDLSNLPFTPRFDRSSVSRGQRIGAFSAGQMMQGGGMGGMTGGGTLTATSIQLGEQGLRGIVSGYTANGSQANFALTLAADSAFARLTGAGVVTVYRQSGTQLRGLTTIANGSTVQVRGLLFLDGGVFRLVASRIGGP